MIPIRVKSNFTKEDYLLYYDLATMSKTGQYGSRGRQICKNRGIRPYFFQVGCDECFIFESEQAYVVGVGGSDKDIKEWEGNFNAYYTPDDRIKGKPKTVRGHHYNYNLQATDLLNTIGYLNKDKPVIYIGVSRGGAIAREAYMIHNSVDSILESVAECNIKRGMCVLFDPPKSFTKRAYNTWYKKRIYDDICHRVETHCSIVGEIMPRMLGWVHRQSTLLKLPNVKGFNHTHIREGIIKFFKKG